MGILVLVGEIPPRNRDLPDNLRALGDSITQLPTGEETLRHLKEDRADLVIVGNPTDVSPRSFLQTVRRRLPGIEGVLLLDSPKGSAPQRDDYLDLSGLPDQEIIDAIHGLLSRTESPRTGANLIGVSEAMEQIRQTIRQVAPTTMTVLITGDSGTGKEVVAQLLHEQSKRSKSAFIAVNCAALPEGVLESELFGHEKGAFTGATARRQGRFELAHKGTLFLDEIGDMPVQTQAKLLRVLEEKRFLRVGGVRDVTADVRLIAATNSDLEAGVEGGSFRKDLYYRLNVINIHLPPLHEKREDIPELVEWFVDKISREHSLPPVRFSQEALGYLSEYHWPGNVRQLRNLIEKIVILQRGGEVGISRVSSLLGERFSRSKNLPIPAPMGQQAERELIYQTLLAIRQELNDLRQAITGSGTQMAGGIDPRPPPPTEYHADAELVEIPEEEAGDSMRTAADFEKEGIRQALSEADGNRKQAARILGIGERTLYRKLKRYNLN